MTGIDNLRQAIKAIKFHGLAKNQAEIARKMGYDSSYLSDLINGRYDLSDKFVNKLQEIFNISKEWIYKGTGNMFLNVPQESCKNASYQEDFRLVHMYNMDARGGFGCNEQTDTSEYIVDMVPFKNAKTNDICVPVTGSSMMPTYPPGTIILLHEIENWKEFIELGQVYVIILTDGRRLLKELRHSKEDRKNNVLCVSHNPQYEPVELPKHLIYKLYMVTALYQKTTM